MGAVPDTLYHFCCDHSAQLILADHLQLRPSPMSWKNYDLEIRNRLRGVRYTSGLGDAPSVLWLTSEPDPSFNDTGLTASPRSHGGSGCNRMEWRFTIDATSVRNQHKLMQWRTFTMLYLPNPEWRINLEWKRAVDTWYVADAPVLAMEGAPYEQAAQQPVPGSPNDG